MATKISDMVDGVTANATDKIPVARAGANRYITPAYIQTMIGLGLKARYHNSADLTFTDGTVVIINFNTSDRDADSAVTTGSSWHYTVPVTGWYDVRAVNPYIDPDGSTYTAGNGVGIDLWKNGVFLGTVGYEESDGTASTDHWLFPNGTFGASLTAGDTINLRFHNFSGASRILSAKAAIEIYRVA